MEQEKKTLGINYLSNLKSQLKKIFIFFQEKSYKLNFFKKYLHIIEFKYIAYIFVNEK